MIEIELQNLSFSYSHQNLFSNVTATFRSGEKIQITGDNGAGKTTLLKLIGSLLQPQEGSIRYLEPTLELDKASARKSMGVALEDSHLLRNFSVVENLRLYQKLYTGRSDFEKIAVWLDRFGMQTNRETDIQHLSQGEQKKIALIKALLHEPKILILDEPTNSLDQAAKKVLNDILVGLPPQHLLLVCTHDHAWAKTWSNKNIQIRSGKIV